MKSEIYFELNDMRSKLEDMIAITNEKFQKYFESGSEKDNEPSSKLFDLIEK